jgi:hypothetical protein
LSKDKGDTWINIKDIDGGITVDTFWCEGDYIYVNNINGTFRNPYFKVPSTTNETLITSVKSDLFSVSPNPFNPSTQIKIGSSATPVAISIYDITGKCVADFNAAANSSVTWNAKGFSSGFYLVKAKSAHKTLSKRIVLNR